MVSISPGPTLPGDIAGVDAGRVPEAHMHHTRRYVLSLAIVAATLAACEAPSEPSSPAVLSSRTSSSAREAAGARDRLVNMMDACDSASFAAGTGNPGQCTRSHGVTFDKFIAQLQRNGFAGAWHFAPPEMTARVGETLVAVNRGGEVHTFTKVAQFGGGIVPLLNQLSGTPVPAPECLALQPADFVAPGGVDRDDAISAPGTTLYECCIHPWMRTVVHVKS
jgi:plastocyanin